jgi:hypothetical protein
VLALSASSGLVRVFADARGGGQGHDFQLNSLYNYFI